MLCEQKVTYKEPLLKGPLFFVTSASQGKSHLLASYSDHDNSTSLQRGRICRGIFFSFPTSDFPGHALHATSRLYNPNHSNIVAQREEQWHAIPWRGLLQTLLSPSPMKGAGKLTLKAVEIDWENICNPAVRCLDLFSAGDSNVRSIRFSVGFGSSSRVDRKSVV